MLKQKAESIKLKEKTIEVKPSNGKENIPISLGYSGNGSVVHISRPLSSPNSVIQNEVKDLGLSFGSKIPRRLAPQNDRRLGMTSSREDALIFTKRRSLHFGRDDWGPTDQLLRF